VTWEPFDFGARGATVDAAEARMRAAAAGVELTRLEVAAATAQAYLAAVATEEGRRAAQAGVERARTVFTVVDARARAGLRPGADAARAQAEVAIAETALARAEQAVQIARADLELWLGSEAQGVALAAPPSDGAASTAAHPLDASPQALRQAAEVEAAEATATAVAHSYAPRIQLEGTAFTRATGVAPDGTVGVPLQGVHNWAAGVSIAFPLFDWPAQGARRAAEQARARQEAAEYDQTLLELRAAQARARAVLQTTRRVAALSQPQLDAARSAEEQARARYAGGLGTIADVADTGRLLTDAEVNAAVSNIAVVQAAVSAAAVGGTFDSLLSAIRTLEGR
jgi:outer membrane protein TolC